MCAKLLTLHLQQLLLSELLQRQRSVEKVVGCQEVTLRLREPLRHKLAKGVKLSFNSFRVLRMKKNHCIMESVLIP